MPVLPLSATLVLPWPAPFPCSAPSLKGLPLDRVVLYDVARGAIYASTAAAEVPAYPAAAISTAAVVGQPDEQLHKPQAPAAAADGEPSAPQSPEGPSQALNPAAAVQQESAKAQVPAPAIVTRKLRFVQPTDERRAVSTAPATLPLAAVGQLLSYGQKWHCSASLIGERTLLTAAHCVYDRTTGAFAHGLYFVPGRFLDTSGSIRAPYGAFDISEVFVSSQYVAGEPQDIWGADLAIVRLNKNVQLGKVVGYLGISVPAVGSSSSSSGTADPAAKAIKATAAGPVVRDIAEPVAAAVAAAAEHAGGRKTRLGRQQQQQPSAAASTTQAAAAAWRGELATAGYPKDRPEGSLVRTQCQAEQLLSNAAFDTIKLTGCSTQLGQSGSPIMNSASQVRGTVSFEIAGEDGYNGAAAITHFSYNTLIREYVV